MSINRLTETRRCYPELSRNLTVHTEDNKISDDVQKNIDRLTFE